MSIHFHSLKIKAINKETEDCVSVVFEMPEELKKDFNFKQGQSLTMRTTINNDEVRRTYSLCSSPLEYEWKVAIKKVEGGLFSSFANTELKKGDTLDVMQPVGKFYVELNPGDALFFHSNLLHTSAPNKSDHPRFVYIACYNKKTNSPFGREGKTGGHPVYTPLHKIKDSEILPMTNVI